MISRSTGHRAKLLLLPRVAGRSTPMTGTDRSNLSCRTLLFLFALLGTPMAARCDSLEDSAKELARKIAGVLPCRGRMYIAKCKIGRPWERMKLTGSSRRSMLNCKDRCSSPIVDERRSG